MEEEGFCFGPITRSLERIRAWDRWIENTGVFLEIFCLVIFEQTGEISDESGMRVNTESHKNTNNFFVSLKKLQNEFIF